MTAQEHLSQKQINQYIGDTSDLEFDEIVTKISILQKSLDNYRHNLEIINQEAYNLEALESIESLQDIITQEEAELDFYKKKFPEAFI